MAGMVVGLPTIGRSTSTSRLASSSAAALPCRTCASVSPPPAALPRETASARSESKVMNRPSSSPAAISSSFIVMLDLTLPSSKSMHRPAGTERPTVAGYHASPHSTATGAPSCPINMLSRSRLRKKNEKKVTANPISFSVGRNRRKKSSSELNAVHI